MASHIDASLELSERDAAAPSPPSSAISPMICDPDEVAGLILEAAHRAASAYPVSGGAPIHRPEAHTRPSGRYLGAIVLPFLVRPNGAELQRRLNET
jgi:hypothetical protein